MKKTLLVVLVVLLATSLFATGNDQKIYSIDSEIYEDISLVYMASGHALPSTSGPWSGDELYKMITAIDLSEVPDYAVPVYERVLEDLGVEPSIDYNFGGMEFTGLLNTEIYAHTFNESINRTDLNGITETAFAGREWWFGKDLTNITPFFEIDWESYFGDHVYTFVEFGLQNAYHGDQEIGSTKVSTNVFAFQNLKFNLGLLDVSIPQKAFASIGGDGWSVEVGRDEVNWGAGQTGNLLISDSFPYYDMVRATAYSEKFKYTYLLAFFPNKTNYYKDGVDIGTNGTDSTWKMDGVYFYSAHRFEGRFFKDKLTVSVTEAITYEDLDGAVQFTALSPLYFMHNAFTPSNSNSTLAFEIDWATPFKGLNVYGQFLLDQGSFPGFESNKSGDKKLGDPDAFAVQLGANYVSGVKDGILKINGEATYVAPYTYLRDSGEGNWGLDYIAAVRARMYSAKAETSYDEFVIGYKYGPDCLTGQVKVDLEHGKFDYSLKVFGMIHGVHDRYTKFREATADMADEDYKADFGLISLGPGLENYRYSTDETAKRTALWTTIDVGASISYEMSEKVDLYATFDVVSMKNIFNYEGKSSIDCQLIVGGSIELF